MVDYGDELDDIGRALNKLANATDRQAQAIELFVQIQMAKENLAIDNEGDLVKLK